MYGTRAPARNSILRWVNNFQSKLGVKGDKAMAELWIRQKYSGPYPNTLPDIQEGL